MPVVVLLRPGRCKSPFRETAQANISKAVYYFHLEKSLTLRVFEGKRRIALEEIKGQIPLRYICIFTLWKVLVHVFAI